MSSPMTNPRSSGWRPAEWLILPESLGDGLIPEGPLIEMTGGPRTVEYLLVPRLCRPGRRIYQLVQLPDWKGVWRE